MASSGMQVPFNHDQHTSEQLVSPVEHEIRRITSLHVSVTFRRLARSARLPVLWPGLN